MRRRRGEPEVEERHYVLRAVEGRASGIGTIIDGDGDFVLAVMSGGRFGWRRPEEPRLDEGATVDLLGPMTEDQAQNVLDAMEEERAQQRREKALRIGAEARETAALILGPYEPAFTHLTPRQQQKRVEALALVIYQARGYSQATEVPA